MRSYEKVVELLRYSLNGYAPNTLDKRGHQRWERAFEAGDEDAFCHLFGPERIPGHFSEFLGYFMIHKVMAGQELLRSAGTVTKKLATWLYEQHYVSDQERGIAVAQGTEAARDLPWAERLASLLYDQSRRTPSCGPDNLGAAEFVEDYLMIDRVEPGALYFAGGIGPVAVSEKACALAEVGWGVNICLARLDGTWRLPQVETMSSPRAPSRGRQQSPADAHARGPFITRRRRPRRSLINTGGRCHMSTTMARQLPRRSHRRQPPHRVLLQRRAGRLAMVTAACALVAGRPVSVWRGAVSSRDTPSDHPDNGSAPITVIIGALPWPGGGAENRIVPSQWS